ncbi:MAG: hypothetical protein ACJA07_004254 [Rhodococcus sp. (in: high G+C Gram-positive bacteria)]|jgi:hypothetical protein|nr:hypothetical protein BJF84_11500 [Rhodococcus sp. CUA-806]
MFRPISPRPPAATTRRSPDLSPEAGDFFAAVVVFFLARGVRDMNLTLLEVLHPALLPGHLDTPARRMTFGE